MRDQKENGFIVKTPLVYSAEFFFNSFTIGWIAINK